MGAPKKRKSVPTSQADPTRPKKKVDGFSQAALSRTKPKVKVRTARLDANEPEPPLKKVPRKRRDVGQI